LVIISKLLTLLLLEQPDGLELLDHVGEGASDSGLSSGSEESLVDALL